MSVEDPEVIEAEFVEEKDESRPRGDSDGSPPRSKKSVLEAFADLLEAAVPAARSVKAEKVAKVAQSAERIVRTAPAAAAAVERETRPLRKAAAEGWQSLKDAGIVHNRPPRDVERGEPKEPKR
jgi:hypothetical protein